MPARPMQEDSSYADLKFPLAGIDLSRGFSQQMPRALQGGDYAGTTPVGNNVRAYEPGTQRARGGQRPGLKKYLSTRPGNAGSLIQELALVVGVGYTPPGPGGGNPYLVQPLINPTTAANPIVATLASAVTAGNAVIVCTTGLGGFPAIADTAGNTYTRAVGSSVGSSASSINYCANVVGGFTAITCTFSNATANGVWVFEFGALAASPLDGTPGTGFGIGSSGTASNVSSITATSAAGDICFAVLGSTNAVPTLSTTGWNTQASANAAQMCLFRYVPTSGTTPAAAFTWSQSTTWSACIASFLKA